LHLAKRRNPLLLLLTVLSLHPHLMAQQEISVPRADGQTTPLMLYAAVSPSSQCAPLAVISHGAGGSERGYQYLAEAVSHMGYTTVVMGHRESGKSALFSDMRADGFRPGIQALVADPTAEKDRLLDVAAALKWANGRCKPSFSVLLGHSMGAVTVMLEAGAKNLIGVPSPPVSQDRFDAYVALSPEGPGIVFSEGAWSGIHKPLLVLTGTRDQALKGGPEWRQIPWHELPGGPSDCQWMGVIDGATHMNFAGRGFGAKQVDHMVTATISEFLTGAQKHACALPKPMAGVTLEAK
jgi:predicted dienelactone hydrolase